MYQVIEGGRAGMFRVGDWNVAKWDPQAINGDYLVGPGRNSSPAELKAGVVIGGMRGVAVPQNAPHKELAVAFANSCSPSPRSRPRCACRLRRAGGPRGRGLSPAARQFAKPTWTIIAYEFPESSIPGIRSWRRTFHRELLDAIANSPPTPRRSSTGGGEMRTKAKARRREEASGVRIAAAPAAWPRPPASAPPASRPPPCSTPSRCPSRH